MGQWCVMSEHAGSAAWKISLQVYLGRRHVEESESAFDRHLIQRAFQSVFLADRSEFSVSIYPWRSDLRFLMRQAGQGDPIGSILVEDVETGERIGGTTRGLPVVLEDFRGRGIGSEIICFSDAHQSFALRPSRFSKAGFAARKAAHRIQVERVLRLELPSVTKEALSGYTLDDSGNLVLMKDWDISEQNAYARGAFPEVRSRVGRGG